MEQFPAFPHAPLARVIWAVGLLIALAGGVIFGYGVTSFIGDVARAMGAEEPTPPDMGPFIRAATVGFPLFAAGGLLAWLASAISPPQQAPSVVNTDSRSYTITNSAGVVVSGRDSTIHGGVHGQVTVSITKARQDVWNLLGAVDYLELPDEAKQAASRQLTTAQEELQKPQPDKSVIAERLKVFVRILQKAQMYYQAGEQVLGPLKRLVDFLGPLGKRILP